jgi:isoquinoline 1-oxidoreductase beta subunit
MKSSISRRDFLKSSLTAAGLTIAVSITPLGTKLLGAKEVGKAVFAPNVFFEVTPDNLVTVAIPNSEMGQGVRTSLAMIVAEELGADWSQIRVKQAPALDVFANPVFGPVQIVAGSSSTRGFYEPLRKAGAAGRAMLVKAAADTWKVPEGECETSMGRVKHTKSGRSLTYGKLCRKASELPVPQNPPLKKESEFVYLGKPMKRIDVPEKVNGTAVFGTDVVVPGMLYASIARPPVYGAKLLSFDQKAAEAVKGVQKVAQLPQGIVVCADTLAAAWKGREALQAKWDQGTHPAIDDAFIEKHYFEGLDKPGAVVKNNGDAKKALADAPRKMEAVYYVPFIAHACQEPMNCTADVQKDRCEIWVPTQNQTGSRMTAAKISGLPRDKVNVNTTFLGVGFGRRTAPDYVAEAVAASKAAGKPVKVVWTREEDIKYDFFRGATVQRIQVGLNNDGLVTGWSHKVSCTSLLRWSNPALIKNGVDLYGLWGLVSSIVPAVYSDTAYDIPNFYIEQYLSDLPIPAGPFRSVQNAPNAFIMECFMDELARATGKDPVEFRMDLLKNNMRARRALETAAEKGGWGKPAPAGIGRGIAQHTCFGTYTAQVADVSVDKDGKIKVHKVVAAIDCGPVVNPGPLVEQVEGGIIVGLSTVLKEQVRFANGGVKSANFDDYKLIKMSEVPEIEVHIIKSTEKIGGIGEVGVPALGPAVANAVFAATGARVRRLPLTPQNVMEAMKKKGA